MPEAAEQAQSGNRRLATGISVILLIMLLEAAIIIVVMMRPKAKASVPVESAGTGVAVEARPVEELLAPYVMVTDVAVSVKVDEAGNRQRTLVMGVHLKIGAFPNERSLDLKYLEREYKPKVESLVPMIKHLLIKEAMARTYGELQDPSVQQQLLEKVKKVANDTLVKYGQKPRIIEVGWEQFLFN